MTARFATFPAVPGSRASLFAGSDQPARRSFGINVIAAGLDCVPVIVRDLADTPFWTLVEFARADALAAPSVLVVPPLSGHFPFLVRDLVLGLLQDFRVHVIDWTNVRHVPVRHGRFGFEDNIAAIVEAIGLVGSGPAVIGICQGGVPSLAACAVLAAAEDPNLPRSLTLIGAPIDPLANPTRVVNLVRGRPLSWFANGATVRVLAPHAGRGRMVYPAQLQLTALLAYLTRHINERGELLAKVNRDDGADPQRFPFLDLFTSIMDIDAAHFVENIEAVFHDCALRQGTLHYGGGRVDLRALRRTALLTIEGERDDVAAPGQTSAAHRLCPDLPARLHRQVCVPQSGHFSLFHGAIFRRQVLPVLREFCARPPARAGQRVG
ncbi:MAG TPA: polyhydroxyalkanoate depolymerase [Paracoccaceae bacterium]|nr:polyhydroxyalkanoate depolymerase [Paracoccaceae bacterium]